MDATTPPLCIAVVEDDDDIRNLLEILIDNSPGFSCIVTCPNGKASLDALPNLKPDVVLMDIELPDGSGIDCVRELKELLPNTEFVMLTNQLDDDYIFESMRFGACGYVLKDTPPAKLLEFIRDAATGGAPMSPSVARKVTSYFQPKRAYELSSREEEVLRQICLGLNYHAIAEKLFISGHTVRGHIKNIYTKLQVNSRGEAVSKAIRDRLV